MTIILDGRRVAAGVFDELKQRRATLSITPGLAIVQIGDNPESTLYVRLKKKAAQNLGMHFEEHHLPATTSAQEVLDVIEELNKRDDIHGIVVQLPLPETLPTSAMLGAVAFNKDVDGLSPRFQRAVQDGKSTPWLPALQVSLLRLLDAAAVDMKGRTALLLAKSGEFRATTAAILRQRGAQVLDAATLDEGQQNLEKADCIITALGQPGVLHEDTLKRGAMILDVGLTTTADGHVRGDLKPPSTDRLGAYSPVPGGIGPVTVASLLLNTVTAAGRTQS